MEDKFSFYDALTHGFNLKNAKANEREKIKKGIWRGGNSGCLTPNGAVIGCDTRQTVLRFLGIQKDTSYDTSLMFDAGLKNEDSITELLDEAEVTYKCEEEIPMKYELESGELVTGRPDTVILKADKPVLGIEHKLICSPFGAVAKAAWFKATVDPKHLVQACHYASYFNIPWVLAYTSRVMYSFPYYAAKDRKAEEKHMIDPDHRAVQRGENGKPFMIRPFQSFYDITLAEDGDTFLLDGEPTKITKSGIKAYYEYCSACVRDKVIPSKRGGGIDHFGVATKKNKNLLYDDFKSVSATEYEQWVNDCRQLAESS